MEENQMYRTFKNTTFVFCIPDCDGQNRGIPYRPRLDDAGAGFEDGSADVARHRSEIRTGVTIKPKEVQDGRLFRHNSLPKKTDNAVCHVRPRGSKANPLMELPNGQKIHTQCYWLNPNYLKAQLFPEAI